MAFNNYTREVVLKAMDRLGKPSREREVLALCLQIGDAEKIQKAECINDSLGLDLTNAITIAFRAAIVDMIESKIMCHNKEGLLCLIEWIPDPKKIRSVDDDWTT